MRVEMAQVWSLDEQDYVKRQLVRVSGDFHLLVHPPGEAHLITGSGDNFVYKATDHVQ